MTFILALFGSFFGMFLGVIVSIVLVAMGVPKSLLNENI